MGFLSHSELKFLNSGAKKAFFYSRPWEFYSIWEVSHDQKYQAQEQSFTCISCKEISVQKMQVQNLEWRTVLAFRVPLTSQSVRVQSNHVPESFLPALHTLKEKLQSEFRQCFSFEHLGKKPFFFFLKRTLLVLAILRLTKNQLIQRS